MHGIYFPMFDVYLPLALVWLAAVIVGLALGSFVTCLVYRLPRGISLWSRKRSFCPHCQHVLGGRELIPVVSYLWQRGRCRNCGHVIGRRYLVLEILVCMAVLIAVALSLS